MSTDATPRPWTVNTKPLGSGELRIRVFENTDDAYSVARVLPLDDDEDDSVRDANATLIVEAVNAYDGLKAQLAESQARVKRLEVTILDAKDRVTYARTLLASRGEIGDIGGGLSILLDRLDAALAAKEGEP